MGATITAGPAVWASITAPSETNWDTVCPGVYSTRDPNSGGVYVSNTTSANTAYPLGGNTVSIPASTCVFISPSLSGPPILTVAGAMAGNVTMTTTSGCYGVGSIPGGNPMMTGLAQAAAGCIPVNTPGGPGLAPAPPDTLMPRDELVFADHPLTLTDENKQAIREFVMQLPSLAKLVTAAREFLAKQREAYAKKQRAKKESWVEKLCQEHEAQMREVLKREAAKARQDPYTRDIIADWIEPHSCWKWISMSRASRASAAA